VGPLYLTSRVADGLAELTDLVRSEREASPRSPKPAVLPTADIGDLRVKESGAWLRGEPGGDALDWLAPGSVVVEEQRQGDSVRVTTSAGVSGWVDARQLIEGPGNTGGLR
jgi:hypothetical protein